MSDCTGRCKQRPAFDHGYGGNDGVWWVRERGPTVQVLHCRIQHPLTAIGNLYLLEQLLWRHTYRLAA